MQWQKIHESVNTFVLKFGFYKDISCQQNVQTVMGMKPNQSEQLIFSFKVQANIKISSATILPVYRNILLLISLIQNCSDPAAAAVTDLSYLMIECQLFKFVILIKRWNRLLCCHSKIPTNIKRERILKQPHHLVGDGEISRGS